MPAEKLLITLGFCVLLVLLPYSKAFDDDSLEYEGDFEEPVDDNQFQAKKACEVSCPLLWEPVCGSDGHTYPSYCEVDAINCLLKKQLTVVKQGECTEEPESLSVSKDASECSRVCPFDWDPLCGSDGVTYGNECELKATQCTRAEQIVVAHKGQCITCPQYCVKRHDPVCGSDGVTYENSCQLDVTACKEQRYIELSYAGPCVN